MIDPDECPVQENNGGWITREVWDAYWATLTPRERAIENQRMFEHRHACGPGGCSG